MLALRFINSGVKIKHATKGLLAIVRGARHYRRRFAANCLVAAGYDSHRSVQLVGRLPQRLVLKPRFERQIFYKRSSSIPLRNRDHVSFANRRGLFLAAESVDHDEYLVRTNRGIPAKRCVFYAHGESAFAHSRAQQVGDIHSSALNAVVATDDLKIASIRPVVTVIVTPVITVAPIVSRRSWQGVHRDIDAIPAFFVSKFALDSGAIAREDAQVFVLADRGIATHGLIVDGHAAIHASARKQVDEQPRNIGALTAPAVIGAQDLPDLFLSGEPRAEENASKETDYERCKQNSNATS
jgi:hypothetical protein